MYSESIQNTAQLNEHIKNDLIESQRLNNAAYTDSDNCTVTGCYRPTFTQIREKILFFEEILPHEQLTDQQVTSYLERWLILMRYHKVILLFNDNATDCRERYQFITEDFLKM